MHSFKILLLSTALVASLTNLSLNGKTANKYSSSQMWKDESFVKSFLGSYGFLGEYEPKISDTEKTVLRTLINLIKASPKAAIKQLEPQIKQSSSAAFDFILANLYFQEGNLAKAQKYYNSATKKHPEFRRAYKNLGLVYVQDGNFEKAIPTISKALELGVVDGRAYGLLAYGYLSEEKYYPAEAAYRQAILIQPNVKDWKIGLARCLLETERYTEAVALFDTLLKDEPNNPDYWLLQGNAYIGKDQVLKAAQNIEIVKRMGATDLKTLMLLGDIYMNNDYSDLALNAYLAAVEMADSNQSKPLVRAADVLTQTGNFSQAKVLITSIRAKTATVLSDEQDLSLLTSEARIARHDGDDATAVATLNKIVERDALNGEALIELGNYYADQDLMAEAVTRYQQAAKIESSERKALVAHAQALVRKNEYREAVPLLKRALQIKNDRNLEDYTARVERAAKGQRS
ncbi:MAG: tetratricopeptide repeat protein [Verrucomicrobiota bacterium]|nr:tetratricopeptide repeat protein [Verrucomicrobiota bacterium]